MRAGVRCGKLIRRFAFRLFGLRLSFLASPEQRSRALKTSMQAQAANKSDVCKKIKIPNRRQRDSVPWTSLAVKRARSKHIQRQVSDEKGPSALGFLPIARIA
jgi:hypothetical protein